MGTQSLLFTINRLIKYLYLREYNNEILYDANNDILQVEEE